MKFENLFQIILVSFLVFAGCDSKPTQQALPKKVVISLSADSSFVILQRLPADVLDYLKADSIGQRQWQSIFSVYTDPKNPELRDFQSPLSGIYKVEDSLIYFIPDKAFQKDSAYFSRFYGRDILAQPSDIIKGHKLKGQAQVTEFDFIR